MKRSELVKKIAETLEYYFDFDSENGTWEQDAERVLDIVEMEGMLPPRHH